ncbi:MAG TPA: response regulator [Enterovirga sp.]
MQAQARAKTCLLVVEDDRDLHELIARTARREGYEVLSAYSGEDALALLRASKGGVDWLLADIRLPGMVDGWVVGSEFSYMHPLRPVIYISGVERDSERRATGSLFLRKPVDVPDLIATFERMSGEAATHQAAAERLAGSWAHPDPGRSPTQQLGVRSPTEAVPSPGA